MEKEKYLINSAIESPEDSRTVQEPRVSVLSMFSSLKAGGKPVAVEKILNQYAIGKCTAISLIQIVWDRTGVLYSDDFNYGLQKKFLDGAWFEGSSVFHAIKAAQKYGMLRKEIFDQYFNFNPTWDYATYSRKLKELFDNDALVNKLLAQCEKPIQGYSVVAPNIRDIAAAVADTDNAVLARYTCGSSWFYKNINGIRRSAWEGNGVIEPITPPIATVTFPITGHAVSLTHNTDADLFLSNTWSADWSKDGHASIDYTPTEAFKIYFKNFPGENPLPVKKDEFHHTFNFDLALGSKNKKDVEMLQYVLIFEECMTWVPPAQRGVFGPKTLAGVIRFQQKYNIYPAFGYCGPKTRAKINELWG